MPLNRAGRPQIKNDLPEKSSAEISRVVERSENAAKLGIENVFHFYSKKSYGKKRKI